MHTKRTVVASVVTMAIVLFVPSAVFSLSTTEQAETSPMTSENTRERRTELKELTEQAKKDAKAKAEALVRQQRAALKVQKTAEQKKLSCENRQAGFEKRAKNYAASARKHYNTFVAHQTKIEAFYASKKLSVAEYEAVLAIANTARVSAEADVVALEAYDATLDCTAADPAQQVAGLKATLTTTREKLQAYRTALKDVIVALKGASSAQKTTVDTQEATQ